jgi:hypothetical protein
LQPSTTAARANEIRMRLLSCGVIESSPVSKEI